jgi:hypothetical protein
MDILSKNGTLKCSVLVACYGAFLLGCQSTPAKVPEEDQACQAENAESCNGEDRGFNPCRINNKLPVCKK